MSYHKRLSEKTARAAACDSCSYLDGRTDASRDVIWALRSAARPTTALSGRVRMLPAGDERSKYRFVLDATL